MRSSCSRGGLGGSTARRRSDRNAIAALHRRATCILLRESRRYRGRALFLKQGSCFSSEGLASQARVLLLKRGSCFSSEGLVFQARALFFKRGPCFSSEGLASQARVLFFKRGSCFSSEGLVFQARALFFKRGPCFSSEGLVSQARVLLLQREPFSPRIETLLVEPGFSLPSWRFRLPWTIPSAGIQRSIRRRCLFPPSSRRSSGPRPTSSGPTARSSRPSTRPRSSRSSS